jgi:hypothetical protein
VKLFSCQKCQQVLFFENTVCTNCGRSVGYSVGSEALVALPRGPGKPGKPFEITPPKGKSGLYFKCKNFVEHDACNWLVSAADNHPYCRSCRLTEENPELSSAENRSAWLEIERAKRRLLFSLYALKLPVLSKEEDPKAGLQFRFRRGTEQQPVMTGHDEGLITLNVAEANASFRENMREMMGEAYRTVLGHLRHESGHYYWDRLVRSGPSLDGCRELFGNDGESYQDALDRHYKQGPPPNWRDSYVSEYATMHPWEDWAETWAHYLHMVDTLETAKSHGLTVTTPGKRAVKVETDALAFRNYESLHTSWQAVSIALNDLNRSMGLEDVYPFVLSTAVHDKLRFVHELIQNSARSRVPVRKSGRDRSRSSHWFSWLRQPAAVSSSVKA